MPEPPSGPGRWIVLGRALPRRTRERIFEPAFYDLLRRWVRTPQPSSVRFGGQALGILAGSFAVAVRRALLSRWMLVATGVLVILAAVAVPLLQSWLGHLYAAS